jgi:hypothetical protein
MRIVPKFDKWQQPSNEGNTGGKSSTPHGAYKLLPISRGLFNVAMKPSVPKSTEPWDTFYFYNTVLDSLDVDYDLPTKLTQGIHVEFLSQADIDACQAFEWQMEAHRSGDVFNMGWQWLLKPTPVLRAFDYSTKTWKPLQGYMMPLPKPNIIYRFKTSHELNDLGEIHKSIDGDLLYNRPDNAHLFSNKIASNVYPGVTNLDIAFQFDSIPGKGNINAHVYTDVTV